MNYNTKTKDDINFPLNNELEEYFVKKEHKRLHKWFHYFEIYDRHFKRFKNKPIKILEIGVYGGGSLEMWRHYFGDLVEIYGVDINPICKDHEKEGVKIFIGDQENKEFLKEVAREIGEIDILIDDGGHTMGQQIATFEELYSIIKNDGVYICEDLHTSYWEVYGGGYRKPNTFIEYSKSLIDKLNSWYSPEIGKDHFSENTYSMSFYDSMLVIEKRKMEMPYNVIIGE